jgi:DNA polymerase III epsilon subunit-like protein
MAVYERQKPRREMTEEEKKERAVQNAQLRSYGYHWTRQHTLDKWRLMDVQNNVEVKEQQAWDAIKSGERTKPAPVHNYIDRAAAIAWARSIANATQIDAPVYCLDTETTGTGKDDVVLQIGICNLRGDIIMDTLVHPGRTPIHPKAQETHGISIEMLADAPTFPEIWDQLEPLLREGTLVIYNSAFDTLLLEQSARQYGLDMPKMITHCLMRRYAEFHGLVKQGVSDLVFVPQKLEAACEHFGLPAGGHDALADAEASRQVLLAMAKESV